MDDELQIGVRVSVRVKARVMVRNIHCSAKIHFLPHNQDKCDIIVSSVVCYTACLLCYRLFCFEYVCDKYSTTIAD